MTTCRRLAAMVLAIALGASLLVGAFALTTTPGAHASRPLAGGMGPHG
jgi:hypothetical protein